MKTFISWILWCILMGAIVYSGNLIQKHRCYRAYANFDPEYVGMITGCMITVDEQRVPSSNFRMTL